MMNNIKKAKKAIVDYFKDIDYSIDSLKDTDYDIDADKARDNYEKYMNNLEVYPRYYIEKWNKKITEASMNGYRYIDTDYFILNDNKQIKYIKSYDDLDELPEGITVEYFKNYFEDQGFEVVPMKSTFGGIHYLRIIWIPLNKDGDKNE